jgi:uroporphyrin-III C-methyltransferase
MNPDASSAQRSPVALVGAGPGNPGLLTLRAAEVLSQADLVLYDRLVPCCLLEYTPDAAELVCVDDLPGCHPERVPGIHHRMIEAAREGRRVVRLKGGDPFVFGRGGEEIEVLAAHDIAYCVVPGITAALGAAAGARLPLTHRRLAHSVTFVSGHQAEGAATDWRFFADPQHTVVFYMAVAELPAVVARLRAAGAASTHPAALIERATLPGQRIVRGSLADIAALAVEQRVAPPALLIVGAVAQFAAGELADRVLPAALASVTAVAAARPAGAEAFA